MVSDERRCLYCLGPVNRPRPARYCDENHARRAANQKAVETGKRNRAWAKIMRRLQDRVRYNREWRQLALGADTDANLLRVFGTLPADLGPSDVIA